MMTNGYVARQSSSYRQGLVLGLTMAELMLLIIFCLLIALAAYLRFEKAQLDAAQAAPDSQGISQADRTVLSSIKQNPGLYEKIREAAGSPNGKAIDEFWRDLVPVQQADRSVLSAIKQNPGLYEKIREAAGSPNGKAIDEFWRDLVPDQSAASEYRKLGTPDQLRKELAEAKALNSKGIDVATALKDHDIVSGVQSVMLKNGSQLNTETLKDLVRRGLDSKAGNQWPPIIDLSEANGHYFKTGSAELAPDFRAKLTTTVPERIVQLMKRYDVDVIEVVGHTDEQTIGIRFSNLDQGLVPVLRNGAAIGSLVPADNAGLGLARAVSVVSVLRQSKSLADYKLIPLSGAQLVNTDETLALAGTPGDIRERRRIEIRLRKSSPHDAPIQDVTASIPEVPLPKPKPMLPVKRKPRPNGPVSFTRP
jgi:outer membrane protein OmpA-like peptidoglycan-associated protein